MPVNLAPLPNFFAIAGLQLGTASAGIKTPGRKDLVLIEIAPQASVAGVFTRNAFCAAPVQVAKEHLSQASPRYLVINTGNANAGTGEAGLAAAKATCAEVAKLTGVAANQVLPFSTGVIGEPLPLIEKLLPALPAALANLNSLGWADAAEGIMTTDIAPKGATASYTINGQEVKISGIAKGSGMIQPNMATMLAYIATDAKIEANLLQEVLSELNELTFNRVTVDGDTSTNDSCILVATGTSAEITPASEGFASFKACLHQLLLTLAQSLVRDGEGATKFITVSVEAALTEQEAKQAAFTVANSPLVKTAFFASDANWGRLLAALGRAPGLEDLNINQVSVHLDDCLLVEKGGRAASYTEEQGSKIMQQEEISVTFNLGRGQAAAKVYTCDFSHDYVSINADYRS